MSVRVIWVSKHCVLAFPHHCDRKCQSLGRTDAARVWQRGASDTLGICSCVVRYVGIGCALPCCWRAMWRERRVGCFASETMRCLSSCFVLVVYHHHTIITNRLWYRTRNEAQQRDNCGSLMLHPRICFTKHTEHMPVTLYEMTFCQSVVVVNVR